MFARQKWLWKVSVRWRMPAVLLLFFFPPVLCATLPPPAITQMLHRQWRTEHGLPQNSVFCVAQDRAGYIWFGTENGLVRFDGVTFKVFTEELMPRIPHNFVSSVCAMSDGSIWAGTRTGGLIRHKDGKFDFPVAELAHAEVTALAETEDSAVWIGTRSGLFRFANGAVQRMDKDSGLPDERICALLPSRGEGLWVGSDRGGFARFENGRFRVFPSGHLIYKNKVRAIAENRETGEVWIGYDSDGLFHFRDGVFKHIALPGHAAESVQALHFDRDGGLWVGTQHYGLMRLEKDHLSRVDEGDGLTSNDINCIFGDHEGGIWVGTLFGGLNQFRPAAVRTFSAREGLPGQNVTCVVQKGPESFWMGTRGAGLVECTNWGFRRVPLDSVIPQRCESDRDIRALLQDRERNVWVATWECGVVRRTPAGELRLFTRADGLPGNQVSAMFETRAGLLWMGTVRDGVALFDPRAERVVQVFTNDFLNCHIRCFAEDSQGTIWVGTQNGLVRFKDGVWTPRMISALPDACIRAIRLEGDNVLWLATRDDGLLRYTSNSLARFDAAAGLAHNRIYDLKMTGTDFWLAGNRGIEKVPVAELNAFLGGVKHRVQTRLYSEADGMRTSECSADSTPGIAGASDGLLLFATRRGLAVIDATQAPVRGFGAPVVIESVRLDHAEVLPGSFRKVPAGTTRVEINYTALSYVNPGKTTFCYQMEGVDREWVEAGSHREAAYYNLRPGNYRFAVQACNDQGAWSQPAVLSFSVAPQIYQTAWFKTALAALLLGSAGGVYRWRTRTMRDQNQILEGLVERRTLEMQGEANQRHEVEQQLRQLNAELELRVAERTAQLTRALDDVQSELRERQKVEQALARSEARLRRIVDSGMVGILFWQRDGTVTEANDTFLRMVGYSRDDLERGSILWKHITPEEFLPRDEAALEEIRRTGVCTPFEKQYIRKDGSRFPILIGGASLSQDGERGVCFVLDISRHKAQEEEIRRLNQTLEARVRERTNELARANEQLAAEVQERKRVAVALSSFSQLGQRLHSARTEKEAAAIIAATAQSLIPHQSCSISLYGLDNRLYPLFETSTPEKNGAHAPGISVPIRNGTRVIGVIELRGSAADEFNPGDANTLQALGDYCGGALDRIHAEEARRETERRFSAFMANAPALAWMKDAEFRYVFTNRTFDEFTGHADIAGKTDFELWPERIASRLRQNDLKVFETAIPLETQESLGEEDGRVLLTLRFLFTTASGERFVAGMAVDITEQKRAEEALHRLPQSILEAQEKERRRVARELHDGVNQAIASVKFRIQTAEQQIQRGDARWQETCSKTKEMLDSVLQQVRRLSRNLRPGELDDFGLIAAVRSACQEFEARTGIEVRLNHSGIESRLSPTLELSLYRIVQESLTNIEKYSQASVVAIHVEREGPRVRLEVADNGRGFDQAALQAGQRGLGLLHMRERAGLAGGRFELHTRPGHGVRIVIEAPVGEPQSSGSDLEHDA